MAVIDAKFCTIRLKDGSGTPKTLIVKLGDGNVTWSEKKARQYLLDRGKLDTVRNGDEAPVDVTVDAMWEHLTTEGITGAAPSVEDAMKQRGPAASWVSSSSDVCEPYALDIEITYEPNCSTDLAETYTLSDFRYETCDHDLKAGTIRFTGKCNVLEANVARVTIP